MLKQSWKPQKIGILDAKIDRFHIIKGLTESVAKYMIRENASLCIIRKF